MGSLNKDVIGHKSEVRKITVERGQLKLFAKAIGETNPIYYDVDAAKAAGHKDILAPPTFATCLRMLAPSKILSYELIGLDYKKLLHGEERYEYFAPFYAGEEISLVSEVIDMYEKKDGALEFCVTLTQVTKDRGIPVVNIYGTSVMRHG